MKGLTVSVVVATRPGLRPKVELLWDKIWPPQRGQPLELIVAEGSSPSTQRNKAAGEAQGEILYFLDDDSIPDSGALSEIERIFADLAVDAAGGPDLASPGASSFQIAVDFVQSSWLGSGPVRDRYRRYASVFRATEKHLILCNMAVRRSAFLGLGGFNPRLYPNEENEFLNRLRRKGSALIASPDLMVCRPRPASIIAVLKQAFGYGRGRAWQFKALPDWGDAPHLVPLVTGLLWTWLSVENPLLGITLAVAALFLCLWEGFRSRGSGLEAAAAARVPEILVARHTAYALGTLYGILIPPRGRDDRVILRRIQTS